MNSAVTANQSSYPLASLYVGDLHNDVSEAMLYEKFSQSGPVLSIRVCRDLVTRRSLGYAYVNFQNPGDAERALDTMNFDELKGIPMRIMWSQRDPSLRKSGVGNIFIKNLDKTIDNKQLYDTFSQFGNILSCKIVKDDKAFSKGYGFVHFELEEAATAAIDQVNGMLLNDRKVYVGRFKNRCDRVREVGEKNRQFTNVYIKNLPEDFKEDELRDLTAKSGNTLSVKLMTTDDASSRCFGFASYATHEEADEAVSAINETEIRGKTAFAGRAQKKVERLAELRLNYEKRKSDRQQKYAGVNLYVKNLDDTVTDSILREAFENHGTITSAKVMTENGQSKGFGFVCFSSQDESTKAVTEMNGRIVGTKPLYVALAQRKEDRKLHLQQQYMNRAGTGQAGMRAIAQQGFAQGYPAYNQQIMGNYYMPPISPATGPNGRFLNNPNMGNARYQMAQRPPYGMNQIRPNMGPQRMPNMVRPGMPQQMAYQMQNMVRPNMQMMHNTLGQPRSVNPSFQHMQQQQNQNNMANAGFKFTSTVRNVPSNDQFNPNQNQMNTHHNMNNMQNNHVNPNAVTTAIGNLPTSDLVNNVPDQNNNITGSGDRNELTAAILASAQPSEQKQMLGEKIYPIVQHQVGAEQAGKVTGMLLEIENGELLMMLENKDLLKGKVDEAVEVLAKHSAPEVATQQNAVTTN